MKTRKITLKKCLAPVAVVTAFHLLSYFPAPSAVSPRIGEASWVMPDDEGDKAFKTHIFFGQNESSAATGLSAVSRKLVDYYGG